ncbi:MAG: helix-turn-helix domain-containing protein [Lachnospiraceae bacterium]|nr:helix-turn-helix domain-containing protein [Lachnospiraceae bacterium]
MNGLCYIRRKSNLTQTELAQKLGVTSNDIEAWECGINVPEEKREALYCFYGLPRNIPWFGELSQELFDELNSKYMYRHCADGKEYYTFSIKSGDDCRYMPCGEIYTMLDARYAEASKNGERVLERVEKTLHRNDDEDLDTRVRTMELETGNLKRYLELVRLVNNQRAGLRVPLRNEIKTVVYAMMVAYGLYTLEGVKEEYICDFSVTPEGISIDEVQELAEILRPKWEEKKQTCLDRRDRLKEILNSEQ